MAYDHKGRLGIALTKDRKIKPRKVKPSTLGVDPFQRVEFFMPAERTAGFREMGHGCFQRRTYA